MTSMDDVTKERLLEAIRDMVTSDKFVGQIMHELHHDNVLTFSGQLPGFDGRPAAQVEIKVALCEMPVAH